tara:strand:+ start:613 stop:1314 length:702 start_codon:yes stop_codon:yes gene_type:complete
MIKSLPWDSGFFDLRIGLMEIDLFDHIAMAELQSNQSNYDLIYVFVPTKTALLEAKIEQYANLKVVDIKVTYSKEIDTHGIDDATICIYTDTEIQEKMYDLAIQSGEFSRFNLDQGFNVDQFISLYRTWVESAANSNKDSLILVSKDANDITGMITLKYDIETATVGLLAVDRDHRGKGIAYKLICFAEDILSKKHIKTLVIPTQKENLKACEFYERLGMNKVNEDVVLHYWT